MKNLNSLLDIARNSNVFNNSNNLLNNNFNNNTSITSIDSISKTNCESKYKPNTNLNLNLAAASTNTINGVVLDSACTDSSYRISDAIAQNIKIN
jgi:hypothetical protein